MITQRTMPLSAVPPGEPVTIVDLSRGSGFLARLAALGFTPGAEVQVVRNQGRGPLIVSVLDTQVALGRGQAAQILVRPREVSR